VGGLKGEYMKNHVRLNGDSATTKKLNKGGQELTTWQVTLLLIVALVVGILLNLFGPCGVCGRVQ
jgi:hypothetical protein